MTEKSGVGSDGITGLAFSAGTGTTHHFMWDVGTDLPNAEDATVYVRLQANDGTSTGGQTTSNAFTIDTKNPAVSTITASQTIGSGTVAISYALTDLSTSNVILQISSDGGTTWTVPTTSSNGNVGAGITPGSGENITWNGGVDFANQEVSTMKVRMQGIDAYGN